jgi:hypothetical protein
LRVVGFGSDLANEIADQIKTQRPSALNLFRLGLPGEACMAIAKAINDRFAPTPVVVQPEPIEPRSSGAGRGAVKTKAWRGRKGSYLVSDVL